MSLFIAPKKQGFSVGRKLPKLGYKSIDTAELMFDDYRLPAETSKQGLSMGQLV
jgi:alkylation response protein AidB-like acyl-CoA dehydrogenase